jgi:hypothetical protein
MSEISKELLEDEVISLENQIELIEDEMEILEEQISSEREHPTRPRAHVIIENQDDGETIHFWSPLEATVGHVISRMYAKFRLTPEPGDRLLRVSDGADVYPEADKTVKKYLAEQKEGTSVRWSFRSETGGA